MPEAPRFTKALQYFDVSANNLPEDAELVISFSYNDSLLFQLNLTEENLTFSYFDEEQDRWISVPSTVDPDSNTVTAEIIHFSLWAIVDNTDEIISSIDFSLL